MPLPNTRLFARFVPILLVSAACVAASPAAAARSLAPRAPAASGFEPADSLEGNYLAAYIAGALRDTAAAASYYRETLKADPRNPEVLERAFVSFLADGAMPDAFRPPTGSSGATTPTALRISRSAAKHLKAKQYATARAHLAEGRARPCRRPHRDAARGLGLCRRRRRQEGARDRRQAQGRARLRGLPRLPCRAHRRDGRQPGRGREAPQDRLRRRAQHAAHRRRLCPAAVAARAEGGGAPDLRRVRGRAAAPPDRARRRRAAEERPHPAAPRRDRAGGRRRGPLRARRRRQHARATSCRRSSICASRSISTRSTPLALVTLADVFERLKQLDRAIEIFTRIPEHVAGPSDGRDPDRPQPRADGQGRGGGDAARALKQRRPDDIEVLMALGNVQRSRKKYAGGGRDLLEGDRAHRHAEPQPLEPVLLPRQRLRAGQAMGEGRGRPQEGARARARRPALGQGRRC